MFRRHGTKRFELKARIRSTFTIFCFVFQDGFVLQETPLTYKQSQQQINKRKSNFFALNHQQTKNIPKPQLKFTDKVNNNPQTPFIPRIRTKPNAQTPLPGEKNRTKKIVDICPFFSRVFISRFSNDRIDVTRKTSGIVSRTRCNFIFFQC